MHAFNCRWMELKQLEATHTEDCGNESSGGRVRQQQQPAKSWSAPNELWQRLSGAAKAKSSQGKTRHGRSRVAVARHKLKFCPKPKHKPWPANYMATCRWWRCSLMWAWFKLCGLGGVRNYLLGARHSQKVDGRKLRLKSY